MINLKLSSGRGRLFLNEDVPSAKSPWAMVEGRVYFDLHEQFSMESLRLPTMAWLPDDSDGQTYMLDMGGFQGGMRANPHAQFGGPDFIGHVAGAGGEFEVVAWKREPFAGVKAHLALTIGPRRKNIRTAQDEQHTLEF